MLIGLTGFAGSGKDTVGAELVKSHGFQRLSFAEALKDLAIKIDPIVTFENDGIFSRLSGEVEVKGWERAKWEVYDVRRFLQALGGGARETFGADCWVNLVRGQIDHGDPIQDYVVTDVRYPNEAEMINGYGQGIVVRVDRHGVGPVNDHASENISSLRYDLTVNNDGTLDDVPLMVKVMLKSVDEVFRLRAMNAKTAARLARDLKVGRWEK
jgi:hypothetical protein